MAKRSWAVAIALALAGCGPPPLTAPAEIESVSDDGRSDLVFWLERHEKRGDGSQTLALAGLAKGTRVGFDLELGKWSENGPGFNAFSTYQCTGQVKSQGATSDAFVAYLVPAAAGAGVALTMQDAVECQVVSAFDPPATFERGKVRIVLALSIDETMRGLADLQVDVETPSGRVAIRNANPAVRRALAEVLGQD